MINRREFLMRTAVAGSVMTIGSKVGLASLGAFDVEESTIESLRSAMASGRISSAKLTQFYLNRIAVLDKKLNSIIELNPDAISIAARCDAERKAGKVRGPLHGIPILIKDNIDTADKMKTTAGSLALVDAPKPANDAFIVARLREAGAVLLGKTNLSEWANFRDDNSISGWSGRGGQTRNPYIIDRNPCGSSSGTAAAISANLAAIGIGTETDGSIVCPSSICGLVGLKPTVGLVSRSGIIPISASQDTAGPMTRTVSDAAALLTVISYVDDQEGASKGERPTLDYTEFLKTDGLRGARIGVARDYWGRRREVDTVTNDALAVMKAKGAELVDVTFPHLRKFGDAEFLVLQYEFKDGLERYLRDRGVRPKTLGDLIRFNNENASRELKYFGQSILESSAKLGPLTDKAYLDAVGVCRTYAAKEGIDKAIDDNRLDAIVAPSNAPTWMIDTVNGDCGSGYVGSSSMPAVAGYPNITVPAGMASELPIGVSFFGKAWSEGTLIKLAFAFEQATRARRKPRFLPSFV